LPPGTGAASLPSFNKQGQTPPLFPSKASGLEIFAGKTKKQMIKNNVDAATEYKINAS
jgi:hypothetical protein